MAWNTYLGIGSWKARRWSRRTRTRTRTRKTDNGERRHGRGTARPIMTMARPTKRDCDRRTWMPGLAAATAATSTRQVPSGAGGWWLMQQQQAMDGTHTGSRCTSQQHLSQQPAAGRNSTPHPTHSAHCRLSVTALRAVGQHLGASTPQWWAVAQALLDTGQEPACPTPPHPPRLDPPSRPGVSTGRPVHVLHR